MHTKLEARISCEFGY